jgi:PhoPQ-activated pathogenicity-related protein
MCINQKITFYLPFLKGLSINNLNIWGTNNKLNFSFKNTVWIKGYGALFYDQANNLIKVRIDKAKTGFINVTGKVFAELKAQENDFITVNRPWVEIQLPK